jgi:hypothetical protein
MGLIHSHHKSESQITYCGFPLADLPEDIIASILAFLEPNEVVRFRLVCRLARSAADDERLWQHFCNIHHVEADATQEDLSSLEVRSNSVGMLLFVVLTLIWE